MNFKEFIQNEMKLSDILKPIPQSEKHHAEGDVFTHTRMVRSRLPIAIDFLKKEQQNTDSIFSNLDLNYTPQEIKLLKLSAWFHDMGKATATKIDHETGKISAIRHEHPDHYMPQINKLSGMLKSMFDSLSPEEKNVLFFVIDNHMSLNQESGLPKKLWPFIFDEDGKIKNEIKSKLLITFIIMDRTGRIKGSDFLPHIKTFKQKQQASKENANKEFKDTLIPLHLSKDKHIKRLTNIKRNS